MSLFDRAVSFFMGRGWTEPQARGIAGNLQYESGGRWHNSRVGDNGTAFEMAQWRGDRITRFRQLYGTDLVGSSFEQQLTFVDWELRNSHRSAGNALRRETTIEGATRVFMDLFERPSASAARSSIGARISAAMGGDRSGSGAAGGASVGDRVRGFERSVDQVISGAITGVGDAVTGGWFSTIDRLVTAQMAARFTAVFIGIVLIALAIAAFVLTSDKTVTVMGKASPNV